ncbi:MAG: efflux RND transporter periplasmic adaptor subunit [Gammaproteobacteria bacterium]|uniref:HlyD family secretion protein n=1 Tax=Rhodoferax sp. TaxID=50421 RepID=UPI0017E53214|nr:efflux RND transporter periplasmic adaptor subunit [Rhodoferax sp.]MBU3897644.1 efflux RND transporter periplasmic adaptor subunit [Gammaproteobacteria bacterium]MBA3058270.1 HlyD family efflux transporter periplasmic adaptor subunit [Rhodoferax sp.]MBU3999451.1 efflux RND transporter periplasmic adaptor subunit [Gammaproteobacteria bacterium]MBU4017712.1 efflux RND transporter periplasmic adaptor subunit [Gammaproteobacteria bacterium]MBU4081155.1 efflux RND transporter periplasmic adaptor
MNKKIVIIGILAAGIGAAVLWKFAPWTAQPDDGTVFASGTMDATEIAVSFRVPGILRSRPVEEGSSVKPGELLAALDDRESVARLHQAQAAQQAAQARLKDLEQGYRPQEIAEARAQVEQARADRTNLEEEARRSEALFSGGATSQQRRDKDRTVAAVAEHQLNATQSRLKLLQSGYRPETINAARAQLDEAQAAVAAARVTLEDLRVSSPVEGVVTRKHAEVGETLGAGRPVVTVTNISKPWVRVYIPENQVGKVRLGTAAKIKVDTFPDREFDGRVSYVSSQAEFTPKNVQTQEERVKLVFAVNVTLDNRDGALKPGMPADVYIASASDGTAR